MTAEQSRWQPFWDRIAEASASDETDTDLGRALARWRNHEIVVQRDGRWLLDGFILLFKTFREILHAIDPTISPDVPPHLLEPVQIAYYMGLPVEELDWPGVGGDGGIATTLARIEAKLERPVGLEGKTTGSDYLSLHGAANITGLSYSHVRRAVLSGELPASSVGKQDRPTYRIARSDLDDWMRRKKGGTSTVPPKPELKKLIERHLPDLS